MRLPMVADQRKDADWEPDIICDRLCVAKDRLVNSQMDTGERGSYLLHRNERDGTATMSVGSKGDIGLRLE